MSLCLEVFAVQLDMLHNAVGSRDDELFRGVSRYFAEQWPQDDDNYFWDDDLTSSTAARAVIDGGPFDAEYGHHYRAAYLNICEFLFTDYRLNNEYFSGFRSGWLDAVGKALQQLGMTATPLDDLTYMGGPAQLPVSDGTQHGEWDLARCRAGLEQWHATTPEQRTELHPEVLGAVVNCVGWMAEAVALSDQLPEKFGIVAFLV
ncbi:hypothetical protein ACFVWG_29025 [Kribbella sp. NPDC058245]|uniref:DUF7691 family protein n=1 Tax=Kribbella sp. NPDC058245 TaxID=3346399 RepID=UPI0036F02B9C